MAEARLTLRDVARSPWSWPVPALLVQALVLLGSSRAWTETLGDRGGRGDLLVGHAALAIAGVFTVAYAGSIVAPDALFVGSFGVRRYVPTAGDKAVLTWMLRAVLLLGLYAGAYWLARSYVFG